MAVKIRLSLVGKKHVPFFRIVVMDERQKRDGKYIENLGTYDQLKGQMVKFDEERLNYWISKGAIPTDSVKKLHKRYKKDAAVATKVAIAKSDEPKEKATPVKAA